MVRVARVLAVAALCVPWLAGCESWNKPPWWNKPAEPAAEAAPPPAEAPVPETTGSVVGPPVAPVPGWHLRSRPDRVNRPVGRRGGGAAARTVHAEPGVTSGKQDREPRFFGLVTLGCEVAMTGIAELTLGGATGKLRRKFGRSSGDLFSADLVTADGRFLAANKEGRDGPFWGIRGRLSL